MAPKKQKTDKAGTSVAATVAAATEAATRDAAAAATEPPRPQLQMDNTTAPGGREQTPKGDIEEIKLVQNGDEVEEDEDGEITEQGRNLKMLNRYQQDILRLQNEKEQLLW